MFAIPCHLKEKKGKKSTKTNRTISVVFLDYLAFAKIFILMMKQINLVTQLKKTDSALAKGSKQGSHPRPLALVQLL